MSFCGNTLASGKTARKGVGISNIQFHRGFPRTVRMTASGFLQHAKELFEQAPIQQLIVTEIRPEICLPWVALPRQAHGFNLPGCNIGDEGTRALANSHHVDNLTDLSLQQFY